MHPVIPLWVTIPIVADNIAVPVLAWLVFQRIARRSARELVAPSFVFIALWLIVAFTLSLRGFFVSSAAAAIPRIVYALIPLTIGYLAYGLLRSVRTVVDEIPMHWIIAVQFYRVLGVVFLVEWMLGAMPGAFALPAGIGDIAIGLSAPFVATRVRSGAPGARKAAIVWNLLGIVDLMVAVTMGVTTTPGPLHLFALDNPYVAISMMPLVLVPIVAVPFSLLLHFIGLHRLTGRAQPVALEFSKAA